MTTFEELRDIRADELRVGDWPRSLRGNRPITRVKVHPRKREVAVTIDGERIVLLSDYRVARVRRPKEED